MAPRFALGFTSSKGPNGTVDNHKAKQELYNGFGDTFTRGIEMVLTVALLGGLGYFIDRVAGLVPVLTIVFIVVGVIGVGVKEYYVYEAAMQAHEADAPWRKGRQR
jgi:F0F1-type ATP synthase assembly protein I